ncbi:MAG: glycosyltransferase family 39 protein, partial [Myxococcota bacterium]
FLAGVRLLFGQGTAPIFLVQQILGLGAVALTAFLARRCFGVRPALAAAALLGLYGQLAMLELKVMASTLAVFLSLASLLLLLTARERSWRFAAFLPGWVLGMACLARPNTLLFVPVAVLWLAWDGRRPKEGGRGIDTARLPAALLLTAGIAAAIAPATLRNLSVAGEWIVISSQAGITFYQANNERAQGGYTILPGFRGTPRDMRAQARTYAEKELGPGLTNADVSAYWMGRGLDYLRSHPAGAALLLAKKLRFWTTSDELSTEYVLPVERRWFPALWAMPLPFGVIFALAFLGARQTGLGRPEHALLYGFVLANLASVLIFYFSSRYRVPAVPVLAGFAGCGLVAAIDRFRQARHGFWMWLAPALALAAYSLTSWSDVLASQAAHQRFNYGKRFMQQQRFADALEQFQAAAGPLDHRWHVHFSLGNAYRRLGRREEALDAYERALELAPGQPAVAEMVNRLRDRLGRETP